MADISKLRSLVNGIPTTIDLTAAGAVLQATDFQVVNAAVTASKPAKLDANKKITSGNIDLASEVTGTLPILNGGTGSTTRTWVDLSSTESIAGVKTFSSFPVTPSSAPTTDYQVPNKKYVDDQIDAHLVGAMLYKGVFDASAGDYTAIVDPRAGWMYKVSVAGTIGARTYNVGDNMYINKDVTGNPVLADIDLIDNTDLVSSVNSKVGAVVLVTDDIAEDGSPVNLWFTDARAKAAAVSDAVYGAGWDGVTDVAPSKNAVYDKIESMGGGLVSDTAYGASWDGVTSVAPSKNAVYDKVEALDAAKANVVHSHAISDVTGLSTALSNKVETSVTINGNALTANVTLDTDDISESGTPTNKWFTDARAKAAAVADSITDAVTDVAPSQNAVFDALAGKEATITAGTSAQYYRGDKTMQTLNTAAVAESVGSLYFTDGRAQTAAVVNSTAGDETVQAASVSAMKAYSESTVFTRVAGEAFNANTTYVVRMAVSGETAGRVYKATSDNQNAPGKYRVIGIIQPTVAITAGDTVTVIKFNKELTLKANDTVVGASAADQGNYLWLNKDGAFSLASNAGITATEEYANFIIGELVEYNATVTSEKIMIDCSIGGFTGLDLA